MVIAVKGPVSYDVQLMDGIVVHRHLDHIRSRMSLPSNSEVSEDHSDLAMLPSMELSADEQPDDNTTDSIDNLPPLRRSQRTIRLPSRYGNSET